MFPPGSKTFPEEPAATLGEIVAQPDAPILSLDWWVGFSPKEGSIEASRGKEGSCLAAFLLPPQEKDGVIRHLLLHAAGRLGVSLAPRTDSLDPGSSRAPAVRAIMLHGSPSSHRRSASMETEIQPAACEEAACSQPGEEGPSRCLVGVVSSTSPSYYQEGHE